jgi:hypothetical protein
MNALPRLLLALLLAGAVLAPLADRPPGTPGRERGEPGSRPSDWFLGPRAWPLEVIPEGRFEAAFQQLRLEKALGTDRLSGGGLTWEEAGPYNIGGRVTALAVVPGGQTVYLGAAAGGVFKSLNGGVNWTPVFDEYGAFSIGAVALDPTDPQTVYVGTGEANASVDSYDGAGLFRSRDGGQTWQHLRLAASRAWRCTRRSRSASSSPRWAGSSRPAPTAASIAARTAGRASRRCCSSTTPRASARW